MTLLNLSSELAGDRARLALDGELDLSTVGMAEPWQSSSACPARAPW